MKLLFSILVFLLVALSTFATAAVHGYYLPDTDTVPPPPESPDTLSGPTESCIGDTAVYTTDIPLGCSAEWYINDTLQGSDSSSMEVVWDDDGDYTISLYDDCDSGSTFVDSLVVTVYDTPEKPGDIEGDSAVCEFTTHTYSTTVGPGENCQWYVAGELQPGIDTFMVYTFSSAGDYLIEVWAVNSCDTSSQKSFLMVKAAGEAPEPPAPIEGPPESCVAFTETYTTSVGPDEDCQWKVDNEIQETTDTILDVTWTTDGQHQIEARAVTSCGTSNPTTLDVSVFELPLVDLGNDTSIYQGQTLILDAGNEGSQYLWSTGDTSQTIEVTETGDYGVTVNNFCGEDSDSIFVDVIVGIELLKIEYALLVYVRDKYLFVEASAQKIMQMLVLNLAGQTIYSGKGKGKIYLPGNGLYILKVRTDKEVFTRKVLVNRN